MASASGRLLLQATIFITHRPAAVPAGRAPRLHVSKDVTILARPGNRGAAAPQSAERRSGFSGRWRGAARDQLDDPVLRRNGDRVSDVAPRAVEQAGRNVVLLHDITD